MAAVSGYVCNQVKEARGRNAGAMKERELRETGTVEGVRRCNASIPADILLCHSTAAALDTAKRSAAAVRSHPTAVPQTGKHRNRKRRPTRADGRGLEGRISHRWRSTI